jgi:hypothetical protein
MTQELVNIFWATFSAENEDFIPTDTLGRAETRNCLLNA